MKTRRSPRLHKRRSHERNGNSVKSHFVGKNNQQIMKSVRETVHASELQRKGLRVGSVVPDIGGVQHRIARITPIGISDLQEVLFVSTGF